MYIELLIQFITYNLETSLNYKSLLRVYFCVFSKFNHFFKREIGELMIKVNKFR